MFMLLGLLGIAAMGAAAFVMVEPIDADPEEEDTPETLDTPDPDAGSLLDELGEGS